MNAKDIIDDIAYWIQENSKKTVDVTAYQLRIQKLEDLKKMISKTMIDHRNTSNKSLQEENISTVHRKDCSEEAATIEAVEENKEANDYDAKVLCSLMKRSRAPSTASVASSSNTDATTPRVASMIEKALRGNSTTSLYHTLY